MINYTENMKEKLISIINQMTEYRWLFVKNLEKDFTRNRKLDFKTIISLLLSMNGNSIYKELLGYWGYTPNVAASSAFVQQRDKILPIAFEFLLNEFTQSSKIYIDACLQSKKELNEYLALTDMVGRQDPHKIKYKKAVCFNYRVT